MPTYYSEGRDGITSTYISSSVATVRPEFAAYLDFSGSAPVRVWSGIQNITLNDIGGSGSYTAIGTYGNISSVTETNEVSAKGIEVVLTGIPQEMISLALQNNYRGRTVAIYLLLFDSARVSYEQTCVFRGRMDQMIINEGETRSSISIKCESRLIDLNRPRERRYTDEYQKNLYPNDTGLEFISGMANRSLYWGNSAPSTGVNTGIDDANAVNDGNS